jgi:hypothetical protein
MRGEASSAMRGGVPTFLGIVVVCTALSGCDAPLRLEGIVASGDREALVLHGVTGTSNAGAPPTVSIEGATVRLEHSRGVQEGTTGPGGRFELEAVTTHAWWVTLEVSAKGCRTLRKTLFRPRYPAKLSVTLVPEVQEPRMRQDDHDVGADLAR